MVIDKENELIEKIEARIKKLSPNGDQPIKLIHDEELVILLREYMKVRGKLLKRC